MKTNYRTILIAAAAATMVSMPALSATDRLGNPAEMDESQIWQSHEADYRSEGERSLDGAARARASDNALYAKTPDDLKGMDVLGADGSSVGKIKTVVMGRDRDEVHAVVSSGGLMGMGAREALIPLSELTLTQGDKIQSTVTKDSLAALPEFKKEGFGVMESDRRISDFSAFEPTLNPASHTAARVDAHTPSTTSTVERINTHVNEAKATTVGVRSDAKENSLFGRTPTDLEGMEVLGRDCQNIGSVKSIVASKNLDQLHAVISSGGLLGFGSRDFLVPLDELEIVGETYLQAEFNQDAVEARPQYQSGEYGELDSDRPVSEYSLTSR